MKPNDTRSVAVVGGGLAGLVAAYRLVRAGADVTLYEASPDTGGVVRSAEAEGFLADLGPNTLVARGEALPSLIDDLGLRAHVLPANESSSVRLVVRGGQPLAIPTSPLTLLRSPLISRRGKLRVLKEPLVPRGGEPEESVAAFTRRRIGEEALDYLVDPFVTGVFAGDPERLVLRWALPRLHLLEHEYGSLVRGSLRARKSPSAAARHPFSFKGGAQALTRALSAELGSGVNVGSKVVDVQKQDDGFQLHIDPAHGGAVVQARHVVLAVPPQSLAGFGIFTEQEAAAIRSVPSSSVAVLALGFRREDVAHPLDAFGMLIPSKEPFRVLGVLFTSSMFPGRAPEGHVLLTCFVGGRQRGQDALLSEAEQLEFLLPELEQLLGVRGEPVMVLRHVWQTGIPQYEAGYREALRALEAAEARTGVAIAGSIRGGVAVPDVVASGEAAAKRVLSLRQR